MITIYRITPLGKPRMTKADKWKKRPVVVRYREFKDLVRLTRLALNDAGCHVTFVIPMTESWSKKKKAEMDGRAHQQTPDKDNLEKALLDALYKDDAHIWDSRVTKRWGRVGLVVIETDAYEVEERVTYD